MMFKIVQGPTACKKETRLWDLICTSLGFHVAWGCNENYEPWCFIKSLAAAEAATRCNAEQNENWVRSHDAEIRARFPCAPRAVAFRDLCHQEKREFLQRTSRETQCLIHTWHHHPSGARWRSHLGAQLPNCRFLPCWWARGGEEEVPREKRRPRRKRSRGWTRCRRQRCPAGVLPAGTR